MSTFNPSRYKRSCAFNIRSFCCNALSEILISMSKIGMSMGKERIAIKVPLLEALEAMAEIMEKVVAKAIAPRPRANKKDVLSTIGYPEVML